MITKKTFNLLSVVFLLGYYARIIPYTWNRKEKRLAKLTPGYQRIYRLINNSHLHQRFCVVAYIIFTITYFKVPSYEWMICMFVIITLTMSSVILLVVRLNQEEIISYINGGLFLFNEQQMELHGLTIENLKKNGTQTFASILLYTQLFIIFTFPPMFFSFIMLRWKMFWLFQELEFIPGINIALTVYGLYFAIVENTVFGTLLIIMIAYSNVGSSWLENTKCPPYKNSEEVKQKWRIMCRAHRILHKVLEDFIWYWNMMLGVTCVSLMTSSMYSMIDLIGVLDLMALMFNAAIFGICSGSLALFCHLLGSYTENSLVYGESVQEQRIHGCRSELEKKFIRSLRPIVWHMGPFYEMNSEMYLVVVEAVIDWVINFLVESDLH